MTQQPPICSYEGSDYQASFWDKADRRYEDAVEGVALRRLLPASGSLLLELGAGAGRNTPRYQGYQRVVLLDYSRTQLEQARQRLGESERFAYVAADIYRLPFVDGLFDGATMIRTLHHMADARAALAQVRRVLQPNAAFILEFANKQNLKAILRYACPPPELEPLQPRAGRVCPAQLRFPSGHGAFLAARLPVQHRAPADRLSLPGMISSNASSRCACWSGMDSAAQLTGDAWQLSPSVFVRCPRGRPDAGTLYRRQFSAARPATTPRWQIPRPS